MKFDPRPILMAAVVAVVLAGGAMVLARQPAPAAALAPRVDALFARWHSATPGCAVGVSVDGREVLARAYGMAELEHNVANTPETIFESGSVSKQFTAAAVLLLARDGKLALDDPVRKYIPELPDYGAPLTIRHMLNHSSGLRDWGSVAGIAGWPRTTRVHDHAHVLEIVSRQRSTNFTPGTRYSYSNSGYNLSAILVARVSGMSFAEFSRQRIFQPLGMTRTSWRDDHQRIVKGRAHAYEEESDGSYSILMPFENVHGNGGLLTTVGDLLKWNHNFTTHVVGDAAFVTEQERAGRFNDGRAHGYALGLQVGDYKGVRMVAHSGSTAGYRAHLNRFPDQGVSVAVLCNAGSANATQYANAVADLYLGDRLKPAAAPVATHTLTAAEVAALAGLYRDTTTGEALRLVAVDGGVRVERGPVLIAQSSARLVTAARQTWEFDLARGAVRVVDQYGSTDHYERVPAAQPTAAQLKEFEGAYVSDEAEATLRAVVEGDTLVLKRRPNTTIRLTPLYADAFTGSIGTVIFRRSGGRVTELSVSQDRVWDLRFNRQSGTGSSSTAGQY